MTPGGKKALGALAIAVGIPLLMGVAMWPEPSSGSSSDDDEAVFVFWVIALVTVGALVLYGLGIAVAAWLDGGLRLRGRR